jgi:hypothetical protein
MAVNPEPILKALHYLFARSGTRIVAHCLDLDLVTSGRDMTEAEARLNAVVTAQIAACYSGGNFAQLRFTAPDETWEALKGAKQLGKLDLEIEIPPVVLPVTRSEVATLPVYRAELVAA